MYDIGALPCVASIAEWTPLYPRTHDGIEHVVRPGTGRDEKDDY